jgi:multidrug efflux pump subunit AcrB
MVYIRDVAHVRDGFAVQTNLVRKDGQRSALLTILKNGGASTLDIVNQVKALLPGMRAAAPSGMEITELFDQSIFVRAAVSGVVKEGVIAACLTATMILLFLGSWRSTFIVMVSIPLSILASYLLSRTLVPVMVKYLVRDEAHDGEKAARHFFARIHDAFNRGFENLRQRYVNALAWPLQNRGTVFVLFALLAGSAFAILPIVGRDFFPSVDAGQFRLHVNAPPGARLEESEQIFSNVEDVIREVVPPGDLALVLDNIGIPQYVNLAFSDSATISSADGEILVSLKPERRGSTPAYLKTLREKLAARFPDLTFYFQPADIISQILNFGLTALDAAIAAGHTRLRPAHHRRRA